MSLFKDHLGLQTFSYFYDAYENIGGNVMYIMSQCNKNFQL